jgi:hypothetical protein
MLKVFMCDCGYERDVEHTDYYDVRLECPRCGHLYNEWTGGQGPNKLMDTFETSVRLLHDGHAEVAATGFGRFYLLWLKHVIHSREPNWLQQHATAKTRELKGEIKRLYGLRTFTLVSLDYRNELEHDPRQLSTVAEAAEFCERMLAGMEHNLAELMGVDVWTKGEAGQLSCCSSSDSDDHASACASYGFHYLTCNIGYFKTARGWWAAYKAGKPDWHLAGWGGHDDDRLILSGRAPHSSLFPYVGSHTHDPARPSPRVLGRGPRRPGSGGFIQAAGCAQVACGALSCLALQCGGCELAGTRTTLEQLITQMKIAGLIPALATNLRRPDCASTGRSRYSHTVTELSPRTNGSRPLRLPGDLPDDAHPGA